MTPRRWRSLGLPLAFASVVALSRLPFGLQARQRSIVNVDELELTLSTIDRLLGVPSTTLAWPAGTLQLLALPGIVFHGLLSGLLELSPRGLTQFVATLYAEPWRALTCIRLLVILVSSVGLAFLAHAFSKRAPRPIFVYATVALFALTPLVWVHSHLAMADAVALGLAAAAIAALEAKRGDTAAALSGACLGLAVGAKFPIAVLVPFLAGRLLEDPHHRRRRLALWALSLSFATLLVVPSMWNDPIRLAKSLFGNLARSGAPLGIRAALLSLFQLAPWLGLAAAGSFALLARRRRSFLLVGSGASIALALVFIGRSHAVADRYYLPVLLVLVALACHALGDEAIAQWSSSRASRIACVCVGLLILGFNARDYIEHLATARASWSPKLGAADTVCRAPRGTKAFVPHDLFPWVARCASRDSLRKLASTSRQSLTRGRSLQSFAPSPLGADFIAVFQGALSEDEQAFSARAVALSFRREPGPIDVRIYGESAMQSRFGFDSREDALSSLRAGDVDLVVEAVPVPHRAERTAYEFRTPGEHGATRGRGVSTTANPP